LTWTPSLAVPFFFCILAPSFFFPFSAYCLSLNSTWNGGFLRQRHRSRTLPREPFSPTMQLSISCPNAGTLHLLGLPSRLRCPRLFAAPCLLPLPRPAGAGNGPRAPLAGLLTLFLPSFPSHPRESVPIIFFFSVPHATIFRKLDISPPPVSSSQSPPSSFSPVIFG